MQAGSVAYENGVVPFDHTSNVLWVENFCTYSTDSSYFGGMKLYKVVAEPYESTTR